MTISFFTTERPEARLDRLVLNRVFHVTDDGFGMWCYLCKTLVPMPEYDGTHEWFSDATGDLYLDHIAACSEALGL